jgi:DNA helicase-2/ATP-dependent DNA helicase PcrA
MNTLLLGLNKEQQRAVMTTDGPVLIVAGAGAGKTKTLTTRIAYLISEKNVEPSKILAITFTNKAAKEMRERAYSLIQAHPNPPQGRALDAERVVSDPLPWGGARGGPGSKPLITTFHSLGVQILREQHMHHSRGKYFSILDSDDSLSLVKDAVRASNLDPKQYEPKKFQSIISRYKNKGIDFFNFSQYIESSYDELVKDVWEKYERSLEKEKAYDFDDLLLKSLALLENNKVIRDYYQSRFDYIHIDEYQDTNGVQYDLVKLLTNEKQNICAVGDTDQNIYSWRGAQIKNMLQFEKDFPKGIMIFLEQNYRSTDIILSAANAVIEKNEMRIPKNLFTDKTMGDKITIAELYSERNEAEYVVDSIIELWDSGIAPEDIAILYRANFQSRIFEEYLIDRGIHYSMTGTKFYERKEIKDVLSYIRAAINPESWTDIKRCINTPARGIGKTTVLKLMEGKRYELPAKVSIEVERFFTLLEQIKSLIETEKPSDVIRKVLNLSGIYEFYNDKTEDGETRRENLEELVTLANGYEVSYGNYSEAMMKFLEDASLHSDQDSLDEEKNIKGVRLMTVHAAKGLEFHCVFVVGLEHGLFPHERNEKLKKEDQEEERRLFYVALTRAKEKLFLTYATTRTIFGMRGVQTPSEFLYDIPIELIEQAKPKNPPQTGTIVYID